jgi:hypothetical protein
MGIDSEAELLTALLREDLCAFIERSFYTLNPGATFVPGWHIHAIAHQLERLERGEIRRLVITVPPRHLKSHSVSVAWYRSTFPEAWLDPKRSSLDEIRTTRHGYRLATSVGGPLTGKGGNFFLIDDPLKAGDAYSEIARNNVLDWYGSTLLSRRDNPMTDRIFIVAQRLHVDDLPGYVLDQGG